MKFRLALITVLFTVIISKAQTFDPNKGKKSIDSTKTRVVRLTNDYFGVQANQLLNQLFNFGNQSSAATNPYMFLYSFNSIKTGWGMNFGFGYTINSFTNNSDANNTRKTNIHDLQLRVGVERKGYLTKKWLASGGVDLIYGSNGDNTTVATNFQSSINSTDTDSKTTTFGGGPRLTLSYFITSRLLLGTEANYYLKSVKITADISNTNDSTPSGGGVFTVKNHTSQSGTQLVFTPPIAIFLIVKL